MEYEYDPRAGFHIVHDIYCEMTRLGYDLKDLYDYSLKEILFILKYRREGMAYFIWRNGTMSRAAQSKEFPGKPEKAMPELFEKKQGVKMKDLPTELQDMFVSTIQSNINSRYGPNM